MLHISTAVGLAWLSDLGHAVVVSVDELISGCVNTLCFCSCAHSAFFGRIRRCERGGGGGDDERGGDGGDDDVRFYVQHY